MHGIKSKKYRWQKFHAALAVLNLFILLTEDLYIQRHYRHTHTYIYITLTSKEQGIPNLPLSDQLIVMNTLLLKYFTIYL